MPRASLDTWTAEATLLRQGASCASVRIFAFAALLALTACGRSAPPPPVQVVAPQPAIAAPEGALAIVIDAPAAMVRDAIVARARSRGAAARAGRTSVTLERALPETPAALAAMCGAHQEGRKVQIVISTDEKDGRTQVVERRLVIDPDGVRCAIRLTEADREQGMKSMLDLKTEVESRVVRR